MEQDQTFIEEQRHLSEIYAQLVAMRDAITEDLETRHKGFDPV